MALSDVVEALLADTAQQYLNAVLPAMTIPGNAAERLQSVLEATFTVVDDHLALLAGLFARQDSIFHVAAEGDAPVATSALFTAPLARLLRDGAVDRSLREVDDPDATAAVLFNVGGWGYVHLRHAQRWTREQATHAVLELVLPGLTVERSPNRSTGRG